MPPHASGSSLPQYSLRRRAEQEARQHAFEQRLEASFHRAVHYFYLIIDARRNAYRARRKRADFDMAASFIVLNAFSPLSDALMIFRPLMSDYNGQRHAQTR